LDPKPYNAEDSAFFFSEVRPIDFLVQLEWGGGGTSMVKPVTVNRLRCKIRHIKLKLGSWDGQAAAWFCPTPFDTSAIHVEDFRRGIMRRQCVTKSMV